MIKKTENFQNSETPPVKNIDLIKRRIVGLTSFFNYQDPKDFPELLAVNIVQVPMSLYQLSNYEKYRSDEMDTEKFNKYLAIEQAFSLYQIRKILDFFKIDNINNLNKLSSDTNLMTYYFLKTALITHSSITDLFYSLIQNTIWMLYLTLNPI